MSERFTIDEYPPEKIIDNLYGKEYRMSEYYPHIEAICKLLNDLHKDNVELKDAMMRLMGEMMSGGMR